VTKTQALEIAREVCGGTTQTAKMECLSYSLPAVETCPVGAKLRGKVGSVCRGCYAKKGNYNRPNVKTAQGFHLESVKRAIADPDYRERWISAMVDAITADGRPWFRWHDSGDVFAADYLKMILEVARRTPNVRHWLPTKERAMVDCARRAGKVPVNLCVRVSLPMIGQRPTGAEVFPVATVSRETAPGAHMCPAPDNCVKCGTCRACFDSSVREVCYRLH